MMMRFTPTVPALLAAFLLLAACGGDGEGNGNNNNNALYCGDGLQDSWEECDDGVANSDTEPDACRTDCTNSVCGDGVTDSGEECDDGNSSNNDACVEGCMLNVCGDGYVNETQDATGPAELCDDGNIDDGDDCRGDCLQDFSLCGNGNVDRGEECDDGSANSDANPNACRSTCQLPSCGDGVQDDQSPYNESCDDGSSNSDTQPDVCRTDCQPASCGDGVADTGEECDGNDLSAGTCEAGGYPGGGVLACQSCSFDYSGCCQDADGDGRGSNCDLGPDECDGDSENWTAAGCANCVDIDNDGYRGMNCDAGEDACDGDGQNWTIGGCYAGLVWTALPAGTFDMGNWTSTPWPDEVPVHSVTLAAFELTTTEVTISQYRACVTAGACTVPLGSAIGGCDYNGTGVDDRPVNCVDWNQAKVFCTWVGGGLPSESQWEYSARSAGQSIRYPWGNDPATCTYAVMYDTAMGMFGCDTYDTMDACSKPLGNTTQGLCDMAGNVWEWIEDDSHSDYTGAPTDGSAWVDTPRGSQRIRRGGSLRSSAGDVQLWNRTSDVPTVYDYEIGFRCAR